MADIFLPIRIAPQPPYMRASAPESSGKTSAIQKWIQPALRMACKGAPVLANAVKVSHF
jgi:hypothetical protein